MLPPLPGLRLRVHEAFDWPDSEFRARIYNADYGVVDPDYAEARPDSCAAMVARVFEAEARKGLRVLGYGGGNVRLAARLRAAGFDGVSWDPLSDGRAARPDGRFGLITCFDVLEHAPDPHAAAREIAELLAPGGMVLFSTLVQPAEFGALGVGWWYVGPRNGHVSVSSGEALRRLWAAQGMALHSFGPGVHAAHAAGAAPAVGRHLLPREAQSASA